jgi:hypothetical protein
MSLIPSSQTTADYYTLELKDYHFSTYISEAALVLNTFVASDLWLKVILFFPGDMDVTGGARNPAAGR